MRAMILAAGRGERMLPLTREKPKPLLMVGGMPLLEHHILNLKAAGFGHLVVNAAHLAQQIVDFCGDGSRWGVRIEVSLEDEPLETAGGIANALPLLGAAPFAVINGDIWCDYPFNQLHSRLPPDAGAYLVLVPNPSHNPTGDFALMDGRVALSGAQTLTFSGVAVYSPGFFTGVDIAKAPLKPLLDAAILADRVRGERYPGTWIDVGTPQRLMDLDHALTANRAPL